MKVSETLLGKENMSPGVSPNGLFFFLSGLGWTWSIMRFSTKKIWMCSAHSKHATDFLTKNHVVNSHYVRLDFHESAGYFLCAGRGLPRLCHYKVIILQLSPQAPVEWPEGLGSPNGQIYKFPMSLDILEESWSEISFRDVTSAQCFRSWQPPPVSYTLLVSKHVSSNHLVGLVIMREEGRVQDSEGLLEAFLNS